jgi:precorrin-2 dehydrogenase/sirohydrochlorin ferrochelatase
MIPIVIDPGSVPMALVGRGEVAAKRLDWLLAGGAGERLVVYADDPCPALREAAGDRLRRRLPAAAELARHRLLWIADQPLGEAAPLAAAARAAGVLVNVEAVIGWCDFHNPSGVRRGDLLLTVSTGGRSPGLAVRIRRHLERTFGPEWAGRLERVAAKRTAWRRRERPLAELARLTDAVVEHKGWLP